MLRRSIESTEKSRTTLVVNPLRRQPCSTRAIVTCTPLEPPACRVPAKFHFSLGRAPLQPAGVIHFKAAEATTEAKDAEQAAMAKLLCSGGSRRRAPHST